MVKREREMVFAKCQVVFHIKTYKKVVTNTFVQCNTTKLYEGIANVQIVDRPFSGKFKI